MTRRSLSALAAVLCLSCLLVSASAAAAAAPGTPNTSFGANGLTALGAGTQLFGVAAQSNGDVVAAGQSAGRVLVERFSATGQAAGTYTGPAGYARAVAIQPNGDIVIAGSSGGAMLVERLTSALTPDSSFGTGGIATAFAGRQGVANGVAVAPSGSIVAAGSVGDINTEVGVAQFTSAGKAQWSEALAFGPYSVVNGVAVQSADNKIVLVGSQRPSQVTNAFMARLTTTGGLDTTFAGTGVFTYTYPGSGFTSLNAVTQQSNGQIVAAGVAAGDPSDAIFMRVDGNGSRDTAFGSDGITSLPSAENVSVPGDEIGAYGVGIAAGGVIVGAGNYEDTGVEVDEALWAVSSSGARETAFGNSGTVLYPIGADEACGMTVAPDGDLVTVGNAVTKFPDAAPCQVNAGSSGFIGQFNGYGALPPVTVPALKVTLTGLSGSYKTATVAKQGLKVGAGCNEACSFKLSLGLSSATAKKLKISTSYEKCKKVKGKKHCVKAKHYVAVTLATGKGSLQGSGTDTITLKLSKTYVKALEKQKSVSGKLTLSATSTATHKGASTSNTVTFKG